MQLNITQSLLLIIISFFCIETFPILAGAFFAVGVMGITQNKTNKHVTIQE